MSKAKSVNVSVEINGKLYEREVSVEVDKKDKGFCRGRVGSYFFYWRPEAFELPMLNLRPEQTKELYARCVSVAEKIDKLDATRKLIKQFLIAYKKMQGKQCADNGTIPIIHENDKIPLGFEPVGDQMFGVDR